MDNETILVIATALLVVAGFVQIKVLLAQNRQNQLALLVEYRKRWNEYSEHWARLIFVGRGDGEYYQLADEQLLKLFSQEREAYSLDRPAIHAIQSVRLICNTLSDVTTKILQGQLDVRDVYPIFGTEVLRQCRALRVLLDVFYENDFYEPYADQRHIGVREEVQNWLIYHDGIRRRCLILIDILWAEAARLQDLPPSDLRSGAEAKLISGKFCRKRLMQECLKLQGWRTSLLAYRLSRFLTYSEYQSLCKPRGINAKKLLKTEGEWTNRLLRKSTG